MMKKRKYYNKNNYFLPLILFFIFILLLNSIYFIDINKNKITFQDKNSFEDLDKNSLVMLSNDLPCSSITQWNITWFFDREHQCGQFANGDWWVLGTPTEPVTITRMTPDFDGQHNGWEVNPSDTGQHGFDTRALGYNPSKVPTLPYLASGNISIVKTISVAPYTSTGLKTYIQTAAVLTVLTSIPENGGTTFFRPPYYGNDKPLYSIENIQWNFLPNYSSQSVTSIPTLTTIEERLKRVQLSHITDWAGDQIRPSDNFQLIDPYGAAVGTNMAESVLRLSLDDLSNNKFNATIYLIQAGIDFVHMKYNGVRWPGNGGHGNGIKLPSTFAAVMLDNNWMKNLVSQAKQSYPGDVYGEDALIQESLTGQPLYGKVNGWLTESEYWNDLAIYPDGDKTYRDPYHIIDGGSIPGSIYQSCCNSMPWKYATLSLLLIPELLDVWNNTKIIEYSDRWVSQGAITLPDPCAPLSQGGGPNPSRPGECILDPDLTPGSTFTNFSCQSGRECGRFPSLHGTNANFGYYRSHFANSMWDNYRSSLGQQTCSSITQWNITWTFDRSYRCGQFVNGDWWVIGPVNIININPPSGDNGFGRIVNGSMINPAVSCTQGYDSRLYGMYAQPPNQIQYNPSLNVALGVDVNNPLVVRPESSLVSTISQLTPDPNSVSQIKTAAVLTVLSTAPPADAFRPVYTGNDKTIKYTESQLNYSRLANLPLTANAPYMNAMTARFQRVWLDHCPEWISEFMHPVQNMPHYYAFFTTTIGDGALLLNTNYTDAQKRDLLVNMMQLGIDRYEVFKEINFSQGPNGHNNGKKFPIIFAGTVLENQEMKNVGKYYETIFNGPNALGNVNYFSEDGQMFYISQEDVDRLINIEAQIDVNSFTGDTATGRINKIIGGYDTLLGNRVEVISGPGVGQRRTIVVNTTNGDYQIRGIDIPQGGSLSIKVDSPWSPQISTDSVIQILGYESSQKGIPEWGNVHTTDYVSHDNPSWIADYRQCCSANGWMGTDLVLKIMGLKELWNQPPFLDYNDRYMQIETAWGPSGLTSSMWTAYRNNYGCTWTRDNSNDIYSQGHYDCAGENVRCSWANSTVGNLVTQCSQYPNTRALEYDPCNLGCVSQSEICGDAICSASETCDSCAFDCGVCSPDTASSSGSSGGSGSSGRGSSSGTGRVNNSTKTQCSDGLDNDGDNLIDYPIDLGCASQSDNIELDSPSLGTNTEESESNLDELNGENENTKYLPIIFWTFLIVIISSIVVIAIIISRLLKKHKAFSDLSSKL